MKLQTVIHEHRFGQAVYHFNSAEDFPVTLTGSQVTRLAEALNIEYDEDEDSLTIVQDTDEEFPILSVKDMEYILTGESDPEL